MGNPKFRRMKTAPKDGREILILTISDQLFRATPFERKEHCAWLNINTGQFADEGAIVGWYPVPALPDGFTRIKPKKLKRKR